MSTRSRTVLKSVLCLATVAVTVEFTCQAYWLYLSAGWSKLRKNPDHYFQASDNPALGYELKPGCVIEKEGRRLRVNRFGIRDDSDEIPTDRLRVALLGDSVVFGTGFSQDQTISALLQKELDSKGQSVRVLNFGVPGYNLAEMAAQLGEKSRVYPVHRVVYMLNPNDFCRRGTRYEGADNGLFRMVRRPIMVSPWLVRKAIYRWHKGDQPGPAWYQWIYRGARNEGLRELRLLADFCADHRIGLSVVLLPAGSACGPEGYALDAENRELASALREMGIPRVDPAEDFADDPHRYFTSTDHLTLAGNARMAELLAPMLQGSPQDAAPSE